MVTVIFKIMLWDDGEIHKLLSSDGKVIYSGIGEHNAVWAQTDGDFIFLQVNGGMAMLDQEGKMLIPMNKQSLARWYDMIKATRWDGKKTLVGVYDQRGRLVIDFVEQ